MTPGYVAVALGVSYAQSALSGSCNGTNGSDGAEVVMTVETGIPSVVIGEKVVIADPSTGHVVQVVQ